MGCTSAKPKPQPKELKKEQPKTTNIPNTVNQTGTSPYSNTVTGPIIQPPPINPNTNINGIDPQQLPNVNGVPNGSYKQTVIDKGPYNSTTLYTPEKNNTLSNGHTEQVNSQINNNSAYKPSMPVVQEVGSMFQSGRKSTERPSYENTKNNLQLNRNTIQERVYEDSIMDYGQKTIQDSSKLNVNVLY